MARARLAEVALDGLPTRKSDKVGKKQAPLMCDFAERYWADYKSTATLDFVEGCIESDSDNSGQSAID